MRPLGDRINRQERALVTLARSVKNIEERIGFLETKVDEGLKHARSGNWTRNLIAVMVAIKLLFENVNVGTIESLFKLIGG